MEKHITARSGDALTTPECTLESLWAALGAGANGLLISCFITADDKIVCTPSNVVDNDKTVVRDVTLAYLQKSIDAGLNFRSTVLDEDGQVTGERGDDTPWMHLEQKWPLKTRKAVTYQTVRYLMQHFARRTRVYLLLDTEIANTTPLVTVLMDQLKAMGLLTKVTVIAEEPVAREVKKQEPDARLVLDASGIALLNIGLVNTARAINAAGIVAKLSAVDALSADSRAELMDESRLAGLSWIMDLADTPYAPPAAMVPVLDEIESQLETIVTSGVSPTLSALESGGIVFAEQFTGTKIDCSQWRAGYSSLVGPSGEPECSIKQDDGLIITLTEGERYSGAAAATIVPLFGDFDATVDFHVSNPAQATTFELAAIGIDPGYWNIDNQKITTRNANLTFDVHGAPPYASSERDQNDGFRSGWNNAYNLTQVAPDWESRSVNMYNKYTRDVGDGGTENLKGSLRLVRSGAVFCSYYKDKHNRAWVGSGAMLVQSMPEDCFIRLALKHWDKVEGKKPPANEVTFKNFVVRQR